MKQDRVGWSSLAPFGWQGVVSRCGLRLWSPIMISRCGLPMWPPAVVSRCGLQLGASWSSNCGLSTFLLFSWNLSLCLFDSLLSGLGDLLDVLAWPP